ncbi:MAG: heparan-alpha-glucosaminide N-acetyltransferase domain-containing protein [Verrucomicrobiota bacterium JB023]|nr:heparan-alpha-glucosaminide N-acetyltransferase domain-containing protein [Verrucomicrobiota bacterium JB023]
MTNEGKKERIIFIDVLRGYAILMMLQGHTIGVVLRDELQDNRYPAHLVWWYLKGLTAPAFFCAAGLIFAYLLARAEEVGGARLGKGLRRGLWLLVLGWVLQIYPSILEDALKGEIVASLRFLGKSHVLHTIGWSLILMVALWLLCRRQGRRFAVVSLLVGQLALLLGPWTEKWRPEEGPGRWLATFVARDYAAFPLFPWTGYALTGASLGVLAWELKWYRDGRAFLVLAGVGALLMVSSGPITGGFWFLMGGLPEGLGLGEVAGRYWRLGEVVVLMGLVGGLCWLVTRRGKEESWPVRILTTCGQETLTIYFLHVIVVYSAIFGFGLSTTCRRAFGVGGSLLVAFLVELCFIILALNLSRLRKKVPLLGLLR